MSLRMIALQALLSSALLFACALPALGAVGCFDPAPIDESYRTLLGRNARPDEAAHFAELIVEGEQVAYFEPYLVPSCAPGAGTCHQAMACNSWVSSVPDAASAGISTYNSDEFFRWNQKTPGYYIVALYRTLYGKLPDEAAMQKWVTALENGGPTAAALASIARDMQAELPRGAKGSWDAIDDVFRRVLGRRANRSGCSLHGAQPAAGGDCAWFWGVANGEITAQQLIHGLRATPEALAANESAACVSRNPVQKDPHAVGEYVREAYRLLLRRNPSRSEMAAAIGGYTGGDTKALLTRVAARLLMSAEYLALCQSSE